jgi:prefoldin subunit 5
MQLNKSEMLRSAKTLKVDDASDNDEKLIPCQAESFVAGARALSAVKFDGVSETQL